LVFVGIAPGKRGGAGGGVDILIIIKFKN